MADALNFDFPAAPAGYVFDGKIQNGEAYHKVATVRLRKAVSILGVPVLRTVAKQKVIATRGNVRDLDYKVAVATQHLLRTI